MVLAKLDSCTQKNANRSVFIILHNTQFQMDQGPQLKARYPESDKRESEEQC